MHRPAFTATFVATRDCVDAVKAFRALLKFAGRHLGLRCVDAREIHHDERNQGENSMDILSDDQTPS
jgi:hypothetical protein